jgi:NAD+ kinase
MSWTAGAQFVHAALVWAGDSPATIELVKELAGFLAAAGVDVSVEGEAARRCGFDVGNALSVEEICSQADFAIVVGNDRTVLRFARRVVRSDIPLVGINHDRLGFLAAVPPGEALHALRSIISGQYSIQPRAMLSAAIWRDGACIFDDCALNDVVVGHALSSRLIDLRVEVDGEHLTTVRADGLLVATPTGSSAYCLSAGGPIVHPMVDGWVLLPVAAHSLSHRPIVLPAASHVSVTVLGDRAATVTYDGQAGADLHTGDSVSLSLSETPAKFLQADGWSYLGTLRQKLGLQ